MYILSLPYIRMSTAGSLDVKPGIPIGVSFTDREDVSGGL